MYLCNIRSVLERSKHYFRKSHQDKDLTKKKQIIKEPIEIKDLQTI